MERVIGRINGSSGPKLIVVGGVHGSEPGGVRAAERLLRKLTPLKDKLRGSVDCFRGNIRALKKGVRFVGRDLNRMWDTDTLETVMSGTAAPGFAPEFQEMRQLATVIHETLDEAEGEVFFFDLHSTSSETIPFCWLLPGGERELVKNFGVPSVHDPDLTVSGTLGQYVAELGHRVMLAEGGRHDDPATVDHMEAMLWITLVHAGLLDEADVQDQYNAGRELLKQATHGTSAFFNIVYHHKIETEDEFVMQPGYDSFQTIRPGEVLAHDARGEVKAPVGGRILMPLYKPPCDDGFLIVHEVNQPAVV